MLSANNYYTHDPIKFSMNFALILVKDNSKGLPGKNLLRWKGKSLLEHTIVHLQQSKLFKEIYVSTNSNKIAKVASKKKCKIIIRNKILTKNEKYVESVDHACEQIGKFKTITIPQVVQPLRDKNIFNKILKKIDTKKFDSVVTVENFDASPTWIYKKKKGKLIKVKNIFYSNVIGREDNLCLIDNAIVTFTFKSWKKSKSISPWPYLGKNIGYINQKKFNKNLKIDLNTNEDKKWLEYLTLKLKWKKFY